MDIAIHRIEPPIDIYDLAGAHEAVGDTLSYPLHTRLACHLTNDGVPHDADRMISHLGARVTTCADHEVAAATAAKDHYESLGN
ncbi:hypothetical protein ABZ628_29475 [Streptomyces diastaticus]|uniref:hypothetical protein n=1 Tax=Streptomyces diastaticus TaxID=1956 RepID=UPI0033D61065